MGKPEKEIYETFRKRAREDFYGVYLENHPHSTEEYVEWMANVWRLNDERNTK